MRFFLAALAVVTILSPSAQAAELPAIITDALNDAASTGNPLVVDAVSDRMGRLFPDLKADINTYIADIATPATIVAAVVRQDAMVAEAPVLEQDSVFDLETAAGPENDLAAELNALDVGNPEHVQ